VEHAQPEEWAVAVVGGRCVLLACLSGGEEGDAAWPGEGEGAMLKRVRDCNVTGEGGTWRAPSQIAEGSGGSAVGREWK
jgi:hypothetical protein